MAAVLLLSACAGGGDAWPEEYGALDVETLQDDAQAVVQCLEDEGFPGYTATADGSIQSPLIPEEQESAHVDAFDRCKEKVGFVMPSNQGLSHEQLEVLYRYEIEARACLSGLGYETVEPPTLQTYIDNYGTSEQWSAWREVGGAVGANFSSVAEQCPDPVWFLHKIFA